MAFTNADRLFITSDGEAGRMSDGAWMNELVQVCNCPGLFFMKYGINKINKMSKIWKWICTGSLLFKSQLFVVDSSQFNCQLSHSSHEILYV